ncbi:MAG: DUF637 domain-containing protein [Rhodocyclales bacterium]|nr:DUF637 domain-containing protein [Rhodocyclales bacterium]
MNQRRFVNVSRGNTPPASPEAFGHVRRPLASLLAFLVAVQPALQPITAYAQIVVDPSAPASQRPNVLVTGNGVPVVNIQTPSAAGVSRNTYTQFDVQQNGVILNNAHNDARTQLGGWVQANPWLAGGGARVILNEVNSSNPSQLRGYLEVAGDRAQVIVANPAGITCNGCGFINASRATLTTGTPIMNCGSLDGYLVQRGRVAVEGGGLDATQTDYTDLIARAVEVNGRIWANNLKLTAGANRVDAGNSQTTPVTGDGAAPGYAIDVAALGGMYAGKITLVGTEAGVGVRNAGEIGAGAGDVVVNVNGQLTNRGLIDGRETVIRATTVANLGTGRIYGDHLAIGATSVSNLAEGGSAPVIAARDRLDMGATTTDNREHALIFSAGDIAIGGALDADNRATGQADTLNNASATIEALGDIHLAAAQVNNTNEHFSTEVVAVSHESIAEYQGAGSANRYRAGDPAISWYGVDQATYLVIAGEGTFHNWYSYSYSRDVAETRIASSDPAQILAGGNLNVNVGNLLNDQSRIMAGGAIAGTPGTLTNTEAPGQRITTDAGTVTSALRGTYCARRVLGSCVDTDYITRYFPSAYNPAAAVESTPLVDTRYLPGTPPAGSGTQVPDSSLYSLNADPTAAYLVASDPRLINYRNWLSSDYLLANRAPDPRVTEKRLGDGFYEQRLLREQIAQLTGRRFLPGYTNDEAQYLALMNAGATFAQAQNLAPGVALTDAQVAQLTSDIVWLVEKEVKLPDGRMARALVPQVYVRVKDGDIDGSGALISANSIDLKIGGDLTNSGTLAGRQVVSLDADNLKNLGGRIAGDAVTLNASTDIENLGGRIEARDSLSLTAQNDLTVASTTNTQTSAQGERTNLGRLAGLYVTGEAGTLTAIAGRNARFDGAEIVNTGAGPVLLAAMGDMSFGTIVESNRQAIVWDGRNHLKQGNSSEVGTRIAAGGDVTLLAGENLSARAVDLQAQGDLSAIAGGDLTIEAGRTTRDMEAATFAESREKLTGKRWAEKGQWQSAETDIQASTLSGKNLSLQAGGTAVLEAAQVSAREKLTISAGQDVYVLSAEETRESASSVRQEQGSFLNVGRKSWQTDVDTLRIHQVGSQLTGNEVAVQAGNNLVVQASSVKSEGKLSLDAGNQILVLAATEVNERHEQTEYKNNRLGADTITESRTGRNGVQNALGFVTHKSYVSPARIVKSLNSHEDEAGRTAARSELSGTDIALRSGSDTTLEAPVIRAETLTVRAGVDKDGQVIDEFARLNLYGVKESTSSADGHDQHATVWDNIADAGARQESLVLPELHLAGRNEDGSQAKADLAAPGGYTVGAVALAPTQYEIAKAQAGNGSAAASTDTDTGSSVREKAKTMIPDPVWTCSKLAPSQCAWVTPPDLTLRTRAASLAKTPGLEWMGDLVQRDDVDWQKVELAAQEWDYHHAGLTKEGAAVVVIVVTILTWGSASSAATGAVQSAGVSTAAGTTGAAVAAGIAAGMTTLAAQAAVSLINNHGDIGQTLNDLGSSESVKQVVTAMLTAGLVQGVTTAFNLPNPAATNATFVDRFRTYATQAAVKAGVHSAMYGEPLSETMKAALVSSLAQSLTAEVGDWGKANHLAPGSLEKMLAHAVVQCAAASVMKQDCGSAALGGAIAEALSPLGDKLDQTDYAKNNKLGGQLGNAIASMTSILVADLMGKDSMTASASASMVDSYNRQLHEDEKVRIKQLANGDAEKEARLTAAACAMVKCYAEYPVGSAAYNALKTMADAGTSLAVEQQQLVQQQGMFGYSTLGLFSDQNVDAAKRLNNTYQLTTRAIGAGEAVLGGLGVAGSVATAPVSCATGIGCVANAAVAGISLDALYTGSQQVVSGQPEATMFNQALQSLGLSPEAANYAEFILGVGAAAKVGSVVSAGLGQEVKAGGTGTREAGTTGTGNTTVVDTLLPDADFVGRGAVRSDLADHLVNATISGKQISGGHDLNSFATALSDAGGNVLSQIEKAPGIYEIQYALPTTSKQFTKTVYDPAIYPDMPEMAMLAAHKALIQFQVNGSILQVVNVNGIRFAVPIRMQNGTAFVPTAYPVGVAK